ncbi:MAG: hypothetical protein JNK87_19225 [Bryobacterales bacterium]|nr:hypothetical protein [Bryobacterales bacterium]
MLSHNNRLIPVVLLLLLTACAAKQEAPTPAATFQRTSLAESNCRKASDPGDPNDTPYLICPGVAGYTLHVRSVESGRSSIDIVDPAGKATPLNYHQTITTAMFAIGNDAEWRMEAGTPIALITSIQAHEDLTEPGKVTNSYSAIAKITTQQVCVTDKLPQQAPSEASIARAADNAPNRPCLPTLTTPNQ